MEVAAEVACFGALSPSEAEAPQVQMPPQAPMADLALDEHSTPTEVAEAACGIGVTEAKGHGEYVT